MRQMEEIRKELSDFRGPDASTAEQTKSNRHNDLLPLPNETMLPVVKVRPHSRRYTGSAPMARALQPKEALQRRRAEERSIALPQDELPSIVHQTLHEFDSVRETTHEQGQSDHLVSYRSLDSLGSGQAYAQPTPYPAPQAARRIAPPVLRPPSVAAATIPISDPIALDDSLDMMADITSHDTLQNARLQAIANADVPTPDEGPTAMYQQGMAALNADRHEIASQAFRAILSNYPEHGLSDNALYWLGESHYDRSMFSQALPLFQDVLTQYPLGNKVPDAMVKVALCFHNLGKLDQAHSLLQQVIQIYPQSDAANVAAAKLPKLAAALGGTK